MAQLRLAAGLAAAIPGAELRARCGGEGASAGASAELVVSDHPAADISPATMRCVAIETWRRCRSRVDTVTTVPNLGELRLGGSIDDLGGGVLRVVTRSGVEQRWLATIIPPDELTELLHSVGSDELSPDQGDPVHARVVPDSQLAVAMIEITVDPGAPIGLLDRAAADVAARCYVAELLRTL